MSTVIEKRAETSFDQAAIINKMRDLAILGGPITVKGMYFDRCRMAGIKEILQIAIYALLGKNTQAGSGGPVSKLEEGFCRLTNTEYALTMNSGTATLHSAYFAVGVKPGDEVIVPAYTFFASAAPVLQLGGIPVFCDIDERTLTADPDDVERRITPKTRAICVVHVWGNPAKMDRFAEIAKKHKIALIEDASHAHGATYKGKPIGSWGDIGCFSLQGEKPVSGGELGIAVTNNPRYYDRMLILGHYGRIESNQQSDSFQTDGLSLGLKYRPHLFGVLLAVGSLGRLHDLNKRRKRNYAIMADELKGCEALQVIDSYPEAERAGFTEFILRYNPEFAGGWNFAAFVKAAQAEGIPIEIDRYSAFGGVPGRLLAQTQLFSGLDYSQFGGCVSCIPQGSISTDDLDMFPASKKVAGRLLMLPAFTKVSEKFIRQCMKGLRKVASIASKNHDCRF
ncbi:DegT/DnrJ/EryC1/StrS family aminotransferase [candidate division WS5 bacterium]|uniref:DegT/DnrJ/EryC1/StrS family aminotransferase n=1 Tax=candidate division WS5 bacterium TaxID=2093353 RepID=A0A419DDB8_9BACT|nr:MAG: DegT/DnrJ/EryC1/StrS family aminotransferase [candidate division WS5 bacterium]